MKDVHYFSGPDAMRAWLQDNHETAAELMVGYWKKHTRHPSLSWSESVDQAICFGWIDGIRRRVDDDRYTIRFTPRRKRSHWSAVNIAKIDKLRDEGLMHPAGWRAFEKLDPTRSELASYEQRRPAQLAASDQAEFESNSTAWQSFQQMPAGYRRTALHWIISAKRKSTRSRRLQTLIACSAEGKRIPVLTPRRHA